ncbi:NAD(P)/FAD-dependent oxidoreductase [Candidatus Woesearchaeota archaeon]|nr:NAD(P)/FAD-dependent oxidoreductase [Candidatus Woesearchaeota archaeon]
MKKVLIIGGGFAGVYAAKRLLKENVRVTLVSKTNYFLFIPMLHEVASGNLCGHNLAEPFKDILRGKNFEFVQDTAEFIDLKNKKVKLAHCEKEYDYLVLSTGSKTNFFGIPGAQNCLALKNLEDAMRIKREIIRNFEASFHEKNKELRKSLCSIAIVGAGPTGVELAIELKEFADQLLNSDAKNVETAQVYLIQRGPHILPSLPELRDVAMKRLRKHHIHILTDSSVKEVQEGKVILDKGAIEAQTIIWSAGIIANTIQTEPKTANDKGCTVVNEFLQLPAFHEVFVVGDCSLFYPQGSKDPIPALAQVATEQGKQVGKNIARLLSEQELEPFSFKNKGTLISLGKGYGAGIVFGIPVRGFFAWWLNRTIYLFKILGFSNKLKTAWEWTLNLFTRRDACEL